MGRLGARWRMTAALAGSLFVSPPVEPAIDCLLGLIALALLITVVVRLDGAAATMFCFLGLYEL